MHHLLGEFGHVLVVVRDEQHGQAQLRLQLQQLLAQLLAQAPVERGEGLVEQQRGRLVDQRARQRGALALAARDLVREVVDQRLQVEARYPLVDALVRALARGGSTREAPR